MQKPHWASGGPQKIVSEIDPFLPPCGVWWWTQVFRFTCGGICLAFFSCLVWLFLVISLATVNCMIPKCHGTLDVELIIMKLEVFSSHSGPLSKTQLVDQATWRATSGLQLSCYRKETKLELGRSPLGQLGSTDASHPPSALKAFFFFVYLAFYIVHARQVLFNELARPIMPSFI